MHSLRMNRHSSRPSPMSPAAATPTWSSILKTLRWKLLSSFWDRLRVASTTCRAPRSPTLQPPCFTASMAYSIWCSRPCGLQVTTSWSYCCAPRAVRPRSGSPREPDLGGPGCDGELRRGPSPGHGPSNHHDRGTPTGGSRGPRARDPRPGGLRPSLHSPRVAPQGGGAGGARGGRGARGGACMPATDGTAFALTLRYMMSLAPGRRRPRQGRAGSALRERTVSEALKVEVCPFSRWKGKALRGSGRCGRF